MDFTQKKCPNCGCGNFSYNEISDNEVGMVCQDCGTVVE